jgi:hypothetical protein
MSKCIQVAAIAAAVGAAFAAAPAQASTTTVYGAGASAVKNSIQLLVLKDYCATGTINFYDNGTGTISAGGQPGGATFVISCNTSSTSGMTAGTIDIGYDTSGGSWKAFNAVNSAMFTTALSQNAALNANPVATVSLTGCTTQSSIAMAVLGNTFTINYNYGCATRALVPGTDVLSFGLTDVEGGLFLNSTDNQPLVNNSWATTSAGPVAIFKTAGSFGVGTELSGYPTQVFGVIFGIGASPKLYSALQADQIASGLLPSTCTAGSVSSPASTCAPNITRAQYASIVANSGGAMNASVAGLFTTAPATTTFELARRDQGSGTQASSNAYFLNDGCASSSLEPIAVPQLPVGSAGNVSYNATTGAAQGKVITPTLDGGTGFAVGVVSVENESKWTGGSGFLKLDGFYPSAANASAGRYGYVSEENLHFHLGSTGDELTFANDLINQTVGSTKVSESAFNYGVGNTANGIVGIYSNLNPNATYGNGGFFCSGWQHL